MSLTVRDSVSLMFGVVLQQSLPVLKIVVRQKTVLNELGEEISQRTLETQGGRAFTLFGQSIPLKVLTE